MRDFLYRAYDMVLERLKYAEAKNTVIVTLLGALVIGAFRIYNETPERPLIATLYFWNFLLFAVMSITVSLTSFMPDIRLRYLFQEQVPDPDNDSLLYYEHIMKYEPQSYIDAVNRRYFEAEADAGKMDQDLAKQIILNARSAVRKFTISYYAIIFAVFGILTPAAGFSYLFLKDRIRLTAYRGKVRVEYRRNKFRKDVEDFTKNRKLNLQKFKESLFESKEKPGVKPDKVFNLPIRVDSVPDKHAGSESSGLMNAEGGRQNAENDGIGRRDDQDSADDSGKAGRENAENAENDIDGCRAGQDGADDGEKTGCGADGRSGGARRDGND